MADPTTPTADNSKPQETKPKSSSPKREASKGWVDQVISEVTGAHLDGDDLTEDDKLYFAALKDRRGQGDTRLDAHDLNRVAAIAEKCKIKRKAAPPSPA